MKIRYGLLSRMVLAIVFGLLAVMALYLAIVYIPLVLRIFSEWSKLSEIPEVDVARAKWNALSAVAVAIVSTALTIIFGRLSYRFAKKWRQF